MEQRELRLGREGHAWYRGSRESCVSVGKRTRGIVGAERAAPRAGSARVVWNKNRECASEARVVWEER